MRQLLVVGEHLLISVEADCVLEVIAIGVIVVHQMPSVQRGSREGGREIDKEKEPVFAHPGAH